MKRIRVAFRRRGLIYAGAAALLLVLLCGGGYGALVLFPKLGAQGAEALRRVAGDEFVARLEAIVYGAQDKLNQERYALGLKKEEAPWAPEPTAPPPTAVVVTSGTPVAPETERMKEAAAARAQAAWKPTPLKPFSTKAGEGQWQAYVRGSNGAVVAYRTFLSPDPARPYVSVGLVVFDLSAAQLNFVVGTDEPKSSVKITRTGKIPAEDLIPGRLYATFNGGFKTQHGNFGVMANGQVLVPPRDGFMTVAQMKDGSVRMAPWSAQQFKDDQIAWSRQNGPPIIVDGKVNPLTVDNAASNWGAALNGTVAVWRSAIGLGGDGRFLYYAAGDGLLVSTMASAMQAAGVQQAMQLDINNFWVHFIAVRTEGETLVTEPLFDVMKRQEERRYLGAYSRDFFYVAARR